MGCNLSVDVIDVPDWTTKADLKSQLQRSNIVHAIIRDQNTDQLRKILKSRWDINENEKIPLKWLTDFKKTSLQRTALCEAARQGWTEGVKLLLEANAKAKKPGALENALVLAVQDHRCPPDLLHLMLKYGADPNGLYGASESIPLIQAIPNSRYNDNVIHIVHLLLENGADPNKRSIRCLGCEVTPISILRDEMSHSIYNHTKLGQSGAQREVLKTNALLFKILINFGADVNYNVDKTVPFLHLMADTEGLWPYASTGHQLVLQYHLNFLFLHGGNIYIEYGNHGMALEYAIKKHSRSNYVRWLIRHGADTAAMNFAWLKYNFTPYDHHHRYSGIPLILLQSGLRVTAGTQTQLCSIEMAIAAYLQGDTITGRPGGTLTEVVETLWWGIDRAEDTARQMNQHITRKKQIFPEYFTQQMVDLQEFCDKSLEVYPEDDSDGHRDWKKILEQIRTLLGFLNRVQSLQWYGRRCVRENLVSLQPSVVKKLPIPARLKRYILCHEI